MTIVNDTTARDLQWVDLGKNRIVDMDFEWNNRFLTKGQGQARQHQHQDQGGTLNQQLELLCRRSGGQEFKSHSPVLLIP